MSKTFLRQLATSLAIAAIIVPLNASAGKQQGHGRALLEAQLTEFNGGCPPHPLEEAGGCIDAQFSIHRAPGCTNGPSVELDGGYSISMVREFPPEGEPAPLKGGSSTLVRTGDGVAFNLSTSDLAPNAPYTVWFVGFNPDNDCIVNQGCDCDANDLDPANDAVFYATGGLSDQLGSATFVGNASYGELPDGEDQIPFDPDFRNALQAGFEIHFVVRAHGKALKGNGGRGNSEDD